MEEEHRLFVGIDWATEAHQVCVLDRTRKVLGERSVRHSGDGLAELAAWLAQLSGDCPGAVAVAIEVPRGPVVELLVERGFHVFAVNPKQLDRFRDRHTVAGAKDDRRDAFVLADSLRTDLHLFRRVQLDDALIIQIRELARICDELREEGGRLTNRLRELMNRYYPQILQLSPAADEPWVWDLLEQAPSPAKAKELAKAAVLKLLRSHRIRRHSAESVKLTLAQLPLTVAPGVIEAASGHVQLLLPRLRLVHAQRASCGKQLDGLLERLAAPAAEEAKGQKREHRDVEILRSLPGVGRVVAATMLAEASQPLAEKDYQTLRALSGAAPVTRQSGKHHQVLMRHGCNQRLRNAVYHWARVSTQHDDASHELYARARSRGHSHGRALRGVADRLLGVLVAMLKSRTLYDATLRRGLQPAPPQNA